MPVIGTESDNTQSFVRIPEMHFTTLQEFSGELKQNSVFHFCCDPKHYEMENTAKKKKKKKKKKKLKK